MTVRRARYVLPLPWLLLCACSGSTHGPGHWPPDNGSDEEDAAVQPRDAAPKADTASPSPDAAAKADAAVDRSSDTGPPRSCAEILGTSMAKSQWVSVDGNGKLAYRTSSMQGDQIMDFSYAGYGGGGVAIPVAPVKQMLSPSGGDDTAAITAALDAVAKLPVVGGVRGAVLLMPGTFQVTGSFAIAASGVVLRGSGSGDGGTIINVTGTERQVMRIHGSAAAVLATTSAKIADAYVPSGARSFTVDDASTFAVGDTVMIQRPVTAEWVKFMGMDTLVRNGMPQVWLAPGTLHQWDRTIVAVAGNKVSIDAPLSDSFDAKYIAPGATVVKYSFPTRITQVGLEHIRFQCPTRNAGSQYSFLRLDAVADGWISDVVAHNFANGLWFGASVKRLTVQDVAVTHDATTFVTSAAPFDFWVDSSQTLIQRSSSTGGNKIWYVATQDDARGPNVLLDFKGTGTGSHVTAHQRWATGFLIDGGSIVGGLSLGNNGTLGDGEGWSMGWGVAWNVTSDVTVQQPPGAMNWAIGFTGTASTAAPLGTYESMNMPVRPTSLYRSQLCERLGPAALANIGY